MTATLDSSPIPIQRMKKGINAIAGIGLNVPTRIVVIFSKLSEIATKVPIIIQETAPMP